MPNTGISTDKLKYPSVVEAVCDLRFAQGASYTIIPGAMSERLRERFPTFEVLPTAKILGGFPDETLAPQVPHHRFKSSNPNALVQTGPRLLTVNMLPTYPGFEVFNELILFVLKHYREVAQPGSPVKVGLRYINHILASPERRKLSDYLKCEVIYPKELSAGEAETSARLVFSHGEVGALGLAVAFPSRIRTGAIGALLDLDFTWSQVTEFNLDGIQSWLDKAHLLIYSAFTSTVIEEIMSSMKG